MPNSIGLLDRPARDGRHVVGADVDAVAGERQAGHLGEAVRAGSDHRQAEDLATLHFRPGYERHGAGRRVVSRCQRDARRGRGLLRFLLCRDEDVIVEIARRGGVEGL